MGKEKKEKKRKSSGGAGTVGEAQAAGPGASQRQRLKVGIKLTSVPSADARDQEQADPLMVPPILAAFPHGAPRASTAEALRFQCRATDAKSGQRKRRRLRLAAETAHVRYEADEPAVARKAAARYMVGVYSKERQQVVLYPVEALVPVGQKVKALEEAAAAETAAQSRASPSQLTYAERRKSLVDTFGTKKKRRVMQSQEENRIRAEGVVGLGALGGFLADSVKAVAAEAEAEGEAPSAAEASRNVLLPPYDAKARSVERVYSARRMLREEAWECLGVDLAAMVEAAGGPEAGQEALREVVLGAYKHWPAYVKDRVQTTPMPTAVAAQGDARWEHCLALLLLRHLFELQRLPPVVKGGAAGLRAMLGGGDYLSEMVAEACLEAFFQAEGGRHTRTKPLSDKLLLHILVLCLLVGGYRASASKIAQDLRMTPGDVATLFRETGATVKRVYGGGGDGDEGGTRRGSRGGAGGGGDEVVVELALPLKFPEVKRGMRSKK